MKKELHFFTCDTEGCAAESVGYPTDATSIRKARLDGWRIGKRGHFCFDCVMDKMGGKEVRIRWEK